MYGLLGPRGLWAGSPSALQVLLGHGMRCRAALPAPDGFCAALQMKIHFLSRYTPKTVVGSWPPHMVCGVLSVTGDTCDSSSSGLRWHQDILVWCWIFPLPGFDVCSSFSWLCCLVSYVHFAAFCVIFHVMSMPSYENYLSFAVLHFRRVFGFLIYTVFSLFEHLLSQELFFSHSYG